MGLFDRLKKSARTRRYGPEAKERIGEMLAALAGCGILPAPGVGRDEVRAGLDTKRATYQDVLCRLGSDTDAQPSGPRSLSVWKMKTSGIRSGADYVRIVSRFSALASEDLPIENIDAELTFIDGKVWFTMDGEAYEWTVSLNDDWLDPVVPGKFAVLLEGRHCGRRFALHDLAGDASLLVCCTVEQYLALNELEGLHFEWLG